MPKVYADPFGSEGQPSEVIGLSFLRRLLPQHFRDLLLLALVSAALLNIALEARSGDLPCVLVPA
jgi:hypothetical protein